MTGAQNSPTERNDEELALEDLDPDSEQMKAMRAWMVNVTNYLHRSGAINTEQRQELQEMWVEATGWGDDDDE